MSEYSMDRTRPAREWRRYRVVLIGGTIAVMVVFLVVVDLFWRRQGEFVDLDDFSVGIVKSGELSVEVGGFGHLQAISERWFTAGVSGSIVRISALPGAQISKGDVIVELRNPEVHRSLEQEGFAVLQSEAAHQVRLAKVESQLLDHELREARARQDLEESLMRLRGLRTMAKANAHAGIELETAEMRAELARQVMDREVDASKQFRERVMPAEQLASKALLENSRARMKRARVDVALLTVRAESDGTLTEMVVESGDSISFGTKIGRIADTSALKGVLQILAHESEDVVAGLSATAMVLDAEVPCTVERVEPSVRDGRVSVDLRFESPLPDGARPELSFRSTILISRIEDAVYVRRPLRVTDNGYAEVFRLNADRRSASRTRVKFGLGTLRDVQVLEGLSVGDGVLLGVRQQMLESNEIRFR